MKACRWLILLWCLVINVCWGVDSRILGVHEVGDVMITEMDNVGRHSPQSYHRQLIIAKRQAKTSEILWTITPEQLPVTADTCRRAGIDVCTHCYHSCVYSGPSYLAFDAAHHKLYLSADTIEVGQAGGRFLSFVADIDKRKITYLGVLDGYAVGQLSPTGKRLLLAGHDFIDVLDIETHERIEVADQPAYYSKQKIDAPTFSQAHWLNDSLLAYHAREAAQRFERRMDRVTENIYDISHRRIVEQRAINK